jgi:hypothetical protein
VISINRFRQFTVLDVWKAVSVDFSKKVTALDTCVNVRLYLAAAAWLTGCAHTVGDRPITRVEVARPVRRFVGLDLQRLVVRHLQVIKVLELIALLGLQESKDLLDVA